MNRLIYIGFIVVLVVILLIKHCDSANSVSYWRNQALSKDILIKEAEGRYARSVRQVSKKELKNILKTELSDVRTELRKNKEAILYYQKVIATFKGKHDTLTIQQSAEDSSLFYFRANYPNDDSSFITYKGSVLTRSKKLYGEWAFSKIPLSVVITQRQDKSWNSRIIGPDYFVVDSMQVISLPPDEMVKKFNWLAGGGVVRDFATQKTGFALSGGIRVKRNYGILGVTTYNTAQIQYLRAF